MRESGRYLDIDSSDSEPTEMRCHYTVDFLARLVAEINGRRERDGLRPIGFVSFRHIAEHALYAHTTASARIHEAESKSVAGVFGYGSLVNPDTHPEPLAIQKAVAAGWARQWSHRVTVDLKDKGTQGVCALTIAPNPDTRIHGVVLRTPDGGIPDIKDREIGYKLSLIRVLLAGGSRQLAYVYIGKDCHRGTSGPDFPVWRSYLDTVLVGYLRTGGKTGLNKFMKSTEWKDVHIEDDRRNVKYARHANLDSTEVTVIDAVLAEHGLVRH